MKTRLLICFGALLGLAAVVQQAGWPLAKLTVHVVGEQGEAIPGAEVKIGFREELSDRDAWAVGHTDNGGNFAAEGHSDKRLGGSVHKEGYYDSGTGWTIFQDPVLGKWQPWDSVMEVTLRPVGKPVALDAKRVQVEIPVLDQSCGYDLEKGDWIAPYGQGSTPDFIFTAHREFASRDDYEVQVEMSFTHPGDGLLQTKLPAVGKNSKFRWDREAPPDGYTPGIQLKNAVHGNTFINTIERSDVFFYRVRTIEVNTRIVAANYGKISGGLRLDGMNSKTCTILFTYYLNLTSLDRNLEWDTKRNLLLGLSFEQTPQDP
jgi:hypothetical protein